MDPVTFSCSSQDECLSRFVKYELKEGSYLQTMIGLAGKKPRTVHLSHGYNQFDITATPVPTGYRKNSKFSKEWAREYHCRNPNPIPMTGKNVEEWIQESKSKWLTIADIKNLGPGKKLDLLVIDRNFGDTLDATATPNKPMKASALLASSKASFTRTKDLQGHLVLHYKDEDIDISPFEFDLAVPNGWYPLKDGILPAKDKQGFMKLYGKSMSWQDMPSDTHVGYRGPMIPWSVVTKEKKQLFWYKS